MTFVILPKQRVTLDKMTMLALGIAIGMTLAVVIKACVLEPAHAANSCSQCHRMVAP